MSDIRLDDARNWVTVDAGALHVAGSDVLLDSAARRGGQGGRHRRALVHDTDDALTLNYARDYTGGVRINDARLSLRCLTQGPKPELPKAGRIGDLVVTNNVTRLDRIPIGETTTLWLCLGVGATPRVSGGVLWAPVSMGTPVPGTG